jgi:hypothetical protein
MQEPRRPGRLGRERRSLTGQDSGWQATRPAARGESNEIRDIFSSELLQEITLK